MKLFLCLILLASTFCLLPIRVEAAGKNVITVTPQLLRLDLSTDKPEAQYTYTNDTNQTIEIALSMQDVKELEDRGIPGLIDPNESKNYKYGLSSWATFSNKNLVISPGESKTVTIFIDKERLTVGGHYASVLAELQQQTNGKTVKLRTILSSLLFIRVGTGQEREEALIAGMYPLQDYFQFPSSFQFRFQNTGNVDVIPYGLLTLTDPFGHEVARTAINEDSLITLPDSIRKYSVSIKEPHGILIPGIYKAHLQVHFGKKNVSAQKDIQFVTLGSLNAAGIGAIILTICVAIVLVRQRRQQTKE